MDGRIRSPVIRRVVSGRARDKHVEKAAPAAYG
jgi:hypothetical protein